MRTCPNCTKPIEDDAVKCPYCGKMTDYNDDKVQFTRDYTE